MADRSQIRSSMKTGPKYGLFLSFFVTFTLSSASPYGAQSTAKTKEVDENEAKAIQASIDRFKDFMQDKNIQTQAKGPDGKPISGKIKHVMNPDDKNPFESDFTYHKKAFDEIKEVPDPAKPGQKKLEITPAYLSAHGKISAGGGSSGLERKGEEVNKKFTKKDAQSKKKAEKGVEYDGMFKTTTRDVKKKDMQISNNSNNRGTRSNDNKDKTYPISRTEIRDEAKKDFEQFGKDGSQSVIEAAKDPKMKGNPKALANGVLLRAAAAENMMGWFRNTLAALVQGRAYNAIEEMDGVGRIELSEEVPNCEAWKAQAQKKLDEANKNKSPEEKKASQKEFGEMVKQCNQITGTSYARVNPQYVPVNGDPNKLKLSWEGPPTEPGNDRDNRVQLSVMAAAGVSAAAIDSNWKYDPSQDKVKYKKWEDGGQSSQEVSKTTADVIDEQNEALQNASKAYEQISKKAPNFKYQDPATFMIEKGQESVMDISQAPAASMDEYGVNGGSLSESTPQTYEQMQSGQ